MNFVFPEAEWKALDNPEVQGWSNEALDQIKLFVNGIGSNALMIIQGGNLIYQWGDCARKTSTASIRKSIMSALIGIAVDRKMLDPKSSLAELEIDDYSPLSTLEKSATVINLLQARSGIYHPAVYDISQGRPEQRAYSPGEFWFYNNWDFNALGSIFQSSTSMGIYEAFQHWLAEPLAMQDFELSDGFLLEGKESIHPVYKLKLSLRDLARFGLLYLQKGCWRDRQLISEDWIAESTTAYTDVSLYTDWVNHSGRGYGYLWWTATAEGFSEESNLVQPCFYASGYGGQFLVVFPHIDLVVAHNVSHDVKHSVSHQQMGRLLQMIVTACPLGEGK
ncbi:serine hydrolase domain-containing protein [Zooshikella ganghwensis]|uniref:serine hydrolase domain-containing protein n=1 Tax=Zooshikella ganghwensis TaxID=202772 RepID=UPI0004151C93|nr:serine hydrolase [Zooshikella ganghwensis]